MKQQLSDIYSNLGLPADYADRCAMPAQQECRQLVAVAADVFGRPARLEAATALAWLAMQQAAASAGIELQLVSAYRSYEYQAQLLLRKLSRGESLERILAVNAAPGFSEHHSGRALDIGCPDFEHLEDVFDQSPAFSWLAEHAGQFGFRMSFPRDNPYGVLYEPWHWYYLGSNGTED